MLRAFYATGRWRRIPRSRFLDAIQKTAARETTGDEVGLCTGYPFTSHTERGLNNFGLTCELPDGSMDCENREFASGNGDLRSYISWTPDSTVLFLFNCVFFMYLSREGLKPQKV